MIEKEIKRIKICGTVKYELPLDEDARFPPTDSTFSCLIPGLGAWFTGHVIQDEEIKKETNIAPTGISTHDTSNPDGLVAISLQDIKILLQKIDALETESKANKVHMKSLQSMMDKLNNSTEPKKSWKDKMHERIQAVEAKNTKQFDRLHIRLQKLEAKEDSAPTGKSLEERVKSLEDWTTQMDIEYDANETWKQQMNLLCIKKFDELYSRTEQLSDEHKELKDAFEAECDKYDAEFENLFTSTGQWTTIGQGILDKNKREIKNIQQQLSELQQAFVKYAICKDTESPQGEKSYTAAEPITPGEFVYSSSGGIIGYAVPKKTADEWKAGIPDHPSGITEQVDIHVVKVDLSTMTAMEDSNPLPPQEPDIVEQIKAGENRLWELRKSVDCVAAIANSASETVSLKEHVIKLMSIHTGLNITGIRMCNKTYKIHYNCKEKGIYVELD